MLKMIRRNIEERWYYCRNMNWRFGVLLYSSIKSQALKHMRVCDQIMIGRCCNSSLTRRSLGSHSSCCIPRFTWCIHSVNQISPSIFIQSTIYALPTIGRHTQCVGQCRVQLIALNIWHFSFMWYKKWSSYISWHNLVLKPVGANQLRFETITFKFFICYDMNQSICKRSRQFS